MLLKCNFECGAFTFNSTFTFEYCFFTFPQPGLPVHQGVLQQLPGAKKTEITRFPNTESALTPEHHLLLLSVHKN